jgi:hypothetical protein
MKPKLLFTLTAIYMGLIGLTILISPAVGMGLGAGASAHLIAQVGYKPASTLALP